MLPGTPHVSPTSGTRAGEPAGAVTCLLTTTPVAPLVKVSEYGTPIGIRVWLSAVRVTRDCAGTCIARGSAPAPWDSPMTTDTSAGLGVGFRTWNATVPPGIPVLWGKTHCEAVAGLPRVSEIPPSPGVPTDSQLRGHHRARQRRHLGGDGRVGGRVVADVLGHERPGRDVDALVRGRSQVAGRGRHERDVHHGVGGRRVEQREDEPATLRRGAVGEVPIGGRRRRARRHAPSERALHRLRHRHPAAVEDDGRGHQARGPELVRAHRHLTVGRNGHRHGVRPRPRRRLRCARRERRNGGQRAVHRMAPGVGEHDGGRRAALRSAPAGAEPRRGLGPGDGRQPERRQRAGGGGAASARWSAR